jgi:GAF domain-containing protein
VRGRGADREQRLTGAFVDLADALVHDYDITASLARLVAYCVEFTGADSAAISLTDSGGELRMTAASSEAARSMELLQLHVEQGPSIDCARTATPVDVADLTHATPRWPAFIAAIDANMAFVAVHALPMRLRTESIGSMTLYLERPGSLPDSDLWLAQAMANVATIGILQERVIHRRGVLNDQLQTALTSRVLIEQAKGLLSGHSGLDMDDVFHRLRSFARSNNTRLDTVAKQVTDGALSPDTVLAVTPTRSSRNA